MPVARNVWQQVEEGSPTSSARRLIIRRTSVRVIGLAVSFRRLSTLRKSGSFFSSHMRKDGSAVTTQGVEIQIYHKEVGTWRLIHVHYSEDRQSAHQG
ncbi:MAG TPA: hypothetical protein VHZ07_21675 [Bryobacteraceae bacterium]|nr:hypothetical protein [Bryobacteraceae bacterium]